MAKVTRDEARARARRELDASLGRAISDDEARHLTVNVALSFEDLDRMCIELDLGRAVPSEWSRSREAGRPRAPRALLVSALDVAATQFFTASSDLRRTPANDAPRGFFGLGRRATVHELALSSIWLLALDMGGVPREWDGEEGILRRETRAISDARTRYGIDAKLRRALASTSN